MEHVVQQGVHALAAAARDQEHGVGRVAQQAAQHVALRVGERDVVTLAVGGTSLLLRARQKGAPHAKHQQPARRVAVGSE
eukprot:scaffold82356_cov36-Phaeocystis_antarctica.AAC.1